jgi:hypothetical protein
MSHHKEYCDECGSKRIYWYEDSALKIARPLGFNVYRCPMGHGYHLTAQKH